MLNKMTGKDLFFIIFGREAMKLQQISLTTSLQLESGPLISHLKINNIHFVFGSGQDKKFENCCLAVKRLPLLVLTHLSLFAKRKVYCSEKQLCLTQNVTFTSICFANTYIDEPKWFSSFIALINAIIICYLRVVGTQN